MKELFKLRNRNPIVYMSTKGYNFFELFNKYRSTCSSTRYVSSLNSRGFVVSNRAGCRYSQLAESSSTGTRRGRALETLVVGCRSTSKGGEIENITPPKFNFALWAKRILGSLFSLLLPLWSQKWQKIKRIEGEAEVIIEEAERVAEVVEKVARITQKVSEDVAQNFPKDEKLRQTATFVQHVSETTAHDAQLAQHFLQKVEELKQDLDNLDKSKEENCKPPLLTKKKE